MCNVFFILKTLEKNKKNVKKVKNMTRIKKILSYRRETALQGALVLAKSGRLELIDNILRI